MHYTAPRPETSRGNKHLLAISISISISILLFIHGSPSGKRPDLQGAMLKKKKERLSYLQLKECNINNKWNKRANTSKY